MVKEAKILIALSVLIMISVSKTIAQPSWVTGTPSVALTSQLSITLNYGLNMTGTIYIIVYNFNNSENLSSSTVRNRAILGQSGNLTEARVITGRRADIGKTLQVILEVSDPNQIHTIYIVAADSKGKLQLLPVRLNATTLPCPQADAGQGGNECDLSFVLNAIPKMPSGTWTRVSGPGNASFSPNANTPNATVNVTVYGTYVFRWTENQGVCRSSDEITVVFSRPPVSDAGRGGSTCGLDFQLGAVTGSADLNGTWIMKSGSGTARFSPGPGEPSAVVSVSEYGRKVFTWIVTSGFCADSADVTVDFIQPPKADAGTNENNCGREYYLRAVPSTGTGTWTRVSGPGTASFSPDNHDPMARVTVSAYGTYVFRWAEVNGQCSSSATVSIGFFEQVAANGGNGGDECDLNFRLNAVPGTGTGTWSLINGPGNATFSPDHHQYNATVTVTVPGAYDFEWREVSSNCSSGDIIRVTFHPAPYVSAGADVSFCKGNSVRLQAQGSGTFLWTPPASLSNAGVANPLASPSVTTVYTVMLTDQWGCRNTDQVTVTVKERPAAYAGSDQILEYVFSTLLAASGVQPGQNGEWNVIGGSGTFSDRNDNDASVDDLSLGENTFVWSVTDGVCPSSSDTVTITVRELLIPSLITPNLDGRNDFFVIRGIESLGTTGLDIFNRWGSNVYHSADYKNDWDGRDMEGRPLTDDTYFYVVRPEKTVPIKGYVVIKR